MNITQCTIIKTLSDQHAWWRVTFEDAPHVRHINVLVHSGGRREEDCRNEALCRARKDMLCYMRLFDKYDRANLPQPMRTTDAPSSASVSAA